MITVAILGSLPFPKPLPIKRGIIASFAKAWSVRGAPNNAPIALDIDAPHIASKTILPQRVILHIINESESNSRPSSVVCGIKYPRYIGIAKYMR